MPFIFLNNQKTMETSRFDACHEYGHLVRGIYSMIISESFVEPLDQDLESKAAET